MHDREDPTLVDWHGWGQNAFDRAARTRKPVLLSLVTQWSPECHEMEATTYAEPRIAANVDDGFVPVRVDADRHPRVRERYNMGGFPSTVFLTPEGEILTGATFLGVDGFRGILDSVRKTWDARGEDAGSVPRALREATPPSGTVDERIEEHMVEQLLAAYDDEFGGWGTDVKFPLPRTIEFALVRARDQALRTLEAVQTHLFDTYDGGFYRYARLRNWRDARREKLADDNAALVRAFARGYRYTGEESYRETAAGAVEYLTTTLWTGEAVAASQGGDEEYFRLEPAAREDADPPAVDRTAFADRNGLAVDALLTYARFTDDDDAIRFARRAREYVTDRLVKDGRVTLYRTEDGRGSHDGRVGENDTHDESDENDADTEEWEAGEAGLLSAQAGVLQGLTTSWSVLGEPGPARAVADWTIANLQTEDGGFLDGPTGGPGLLDRPLYPLDTTAELASALLDLSVLTGEPRYRTAAREAIESFAGATDRMGVEVAHFASVAARLQDTRAVEVATPAGSDLHRAALRLADHETVVVPTGAGDADETGALERQPLCDEAVPADTARLVVDGTEVGRASSPAELEDILTDPN